MGLFAVCKDFCQVEAPIQRNAKHRAVRARVRVRGNDQGYSLDARYQPKRVAFAADKLTDQRNLMKPAHLRRAGDVQMSLAQRAKRCARLALICELMRQQPSIGCQPASGIKPTALAAIIKKRLLKVRGHYRAYLNNRTVLRFIILIRHLNLLIIAQH
jgi:hypothetical protein